VMVLGNTGSWGIGRLSAGISFVKNQYLTLSLDSFSRRSESLLFP